MNKFKFLSLGLLCVTLAFGYNSVEAMEDSTNIIKDNEEQNDSIQINYNIQLINNDLQQMMDYIQLHTMEETANYFKMDIKKLDKQLREYCIINDKGQKIKVNELLNYLYDNDNNHNTRKATDNFGISENIINNIWNKFGIVNNKNEYIPHKAIEDDISSVKIIIDKNPSVLMSTKTKLVINKSNLEIISEKYSIDINKVNKIFRNIVVKDGVLVDDVLNCIFFNGHINDSTRNRKSKTFEAFNKRISYVKIMELYSQFMINSKDNNYILYDKILAYLISLPNTKNLKVIDISNKFNLDYKIVNKIARTIKVVGDKSVDNILNWINCAHNIDADNIKEYFGYCDNELIKLIIDIDSKFNDNNLQYTNYYNLLTCLEQNKYDLIKTASELDLYVTDIVQKLLNKTSSKYGLQDNIKNNILEQYVDYIISTKGTHLCNLTLNAISTTIGIDIRTTYEQKVAELSEIKKGK